MDSPITPITAQEVQQDFQDVRREHYFRRCLIAFDIFCNVVFFLGMRTKPSLATRPVQQLKASCGES